MRTGTNAFTSFHAAWKYYEAQGLEASDIDDMLHMGTITLTKPTPAKGQMVYAGPDGRYWIEDMQQ